MTPGRPSPTRSPRPFREETLTKPRIPPFAAGLSAAQPSPEGVLLEILSR